MQPIFQFDDLLTKANVTPRDCVSGAIALSAVILAFLYFALGWSTNRIKDADGSGSPALVCWASATGTMTFTIFGTHFFAPFYFALNTKIYIWHTVPCLAMLYIWFYYWRILAKLFLLHRRVNGLLSPFTREMFESLHDYRRGFWLNIGAVLVIAWSTFFETLIGDFPAGIMGLCFVFVAVAGLGCYVSLSGDLFPRALNADASG